MELLSLEQTPVTIKDTGSVITHPKSHKLCLLCGSDNRLGLGLKFMQGKRGEVFAEIEGHVLLQGYEGILHGGVIAALLDSAMTNALFYNGYEGVTGDMHIKFIKSVPVDCILTVRGRVVGKSNPLFKTEGELILNKKVVASAKARFVDRGFKL